MSKRTGVVGTVGANDFCLAKSTGAFDPAALFLGKMCSAPVAGETFGKLLFSEINDYNQTEDMKCTHNGVVLDKTIRQNSA